MPTAAANHIPSVLLIDSSTEEREVLRFALQRRGLRIFEADEAQAGIVLARQHQPDVIVYDADDNATGAIQVQAEFDAAAEHQPATLIVLGRFREFGDLPREQVLSKPYHFGPLVQTIEALVARAA